MNDHRPSPLVVVRTWPVLRLEKTSSATHHAHNTADSIHHVFLSAAIWHSPKLLTTSQIEYSLQVV